jgi:DNA-binding transcriptional ArsR family regulator
MRSIAPALFPVFRSPAQAEILAALLLHPAEERTVTDLSRQLNMPQATVSDEVARLVDAELLTARKVGRSNLLRPNTANKLITPLSEIVLATMGPHLAVADAFAGVDGTDRVLIYGSWAARYKGQPGPPPNDLDILIVGTPDRTTVYAAADTVERVTGLPVHPVIASPQRWNDNTDSLIADIKANPVVDIEPTA